MRRKTLRATPAEVPVPAASPVLIAMIAMAVIATAVTVIAVAAIDVAVMAVVIAQPAKNEMWQLHLGSQWHFHLVVPPINQQVSRQDSLHPNQPIIIKLQSQRKSSSRIAIQTRIG